MFQLAGTPAVGTTAGSSWYTEHFKEAAEELGSAYYSYRRFPWSVMAISMSAM